jgi:hypothetical protein
MPVPPIGANCLSGHPAVKLAVSEGLTPDAAILIFKY